TPSPQPHWLNFLHNQPLQLQILTQTNSIFWDAIGALAGVSLIQPNLSVDVSGTWQAPRGKLEMQVKQIKWPGKRARPSDGKSATEEGKQKTKAALRLENLRLLADLD